MNSLTLTKLHNFAALLEAAQCTGLVCKGYNPKLHDHKTHVHVGKKFARVDIGSSGRYMVDLETEEIFGIKAYGVIHRGHRFGTLDTLEQWNWSDYRAVPVPCEAGKAVVV